MDQPIAAPRHGCWLHPKNLDLFQGALHDFHETCATHRPEAPGHGLPISALRLPASSDKA